MDPTRIALFDLAEKRLAWTAQRQNVLAANIANANTPGFQGRDVEPFAKVLAGTTAIGPVLTQPGHMAGTAPSGLASLINAVHSSVDSRSLSTRNVGDSTLMATWIARPSIVICGASG